MEGFIDIGYTEALRDFTFWIVFGIALAFIAQRICANPRYRRAQFTEGQAHPLLGWILAIAILIIFVRFGFPMFFYRFYGVQITQDRIILYYPLSRRVELNKQDVSRSGTKRYPAARTPWHGKYIFLDTKDGYRYKSIITPGAEHAWNRMRERGLP
jgi:hypothetical protein